MQAVNIKFWVGYCVIILFQEKSLRMLTGSSKRNRFDHRASAPPSEG